MDSTKHTVIVGDAGLNQRVDVFIANALNMSRRKVQTAILNGNVLLDDTAILNNDHRTKYGESYTITLEQSIPQHNHYEPNSSVPLHIVYEDDAILVVNKAPGVTMHHGTGTENNTLVNALLAHCGPGILTVGSDARPGIVHRLDKDTSGLVVLAKTQTAHYTLSRALMEKQFRKEYLALVWDVPHKKHGFIEAPIRVKRSDRTAMEVATYSGKPACTEFTVIRTFGSIASLVQCTLHTGRTHQIRVHMSHIGHSIIGDAKYGKNERKCARLGIPQLSLYKRQALHSHILSFPHPTKNTEMSFKSEPWDDMLQLMQTISSAC